MKNLFLITLLSLTGICFSQVTNYTGKVGINTDNPTETLHVNGIAHGNLLYLRSPGEPQELPIYFMSSEVTERNLNIFNPPPGKPSLVNLIDLRFNNVGNQGVVDYDTKIDAIDYVVAVRSFSLSRSATYDINDLEVYTVHNSSPSNNSSSTYFQGSPDFVAFISGGTWHVRAQYKDCRFVNGDAVVESSDRFSMRIQLLAYKKIITKGINTVQTINLQGTNGSSNTYIIPKPNGF